MASRSLKKRSVSRIQARYAYAIVIVFDNAETRPPDAPELNASRHDMKHSAAAHFIEKVLACALQFTKATIRHIEIRNLWYE